MSKKKATQFFQQCCCSRPYAVLSQELGLEIQPAQRTGYPPGSTCIDTLQFGRDLVDPLFTDCAVAAACWE